MGGAHVSDLSLQATFLVWLYKPTRTTISVTDHFPPPQCQEIHFLDDSVAAFFFIHCVVGQLSEKWSFNRNL